MTTTQLQSELRKILPFLPQSFSRKGQTLDSALDGYRWQQELSGSALDLILMSYRYAHVFEIQLKAFTPKAVKPALLTDLWLAGFTALLTRDKVPEFAIISETVNVAKSHFGPHTGGLTNAFMRATQRAKTEWLAKFDQSPTNALPPWLLARWRPLGAETLATIGKALLTRPTSGVAGFGQDLQFRRAAWSSEVFKSEEAFQAMNEGSFGFCQWARQKIPAASKKFLDTCAAPGGKSIFFLQSLLKDNAQAHATLCEAKATRLELLRENLTRWKIDSEVASTELFEWGKDPLPSAWTQDKWDFVLCDLPCSGSGTLLTRPDVLYRKWEAEMPALKKLQKHILSEVQKVPAHALVVSICSVDPEEVAHVSQIIGAEPSFSSWNGKSAVEPGSEGITAWYCGPLAPPVQ